MKHFFKTIVHCALCIVNRLTTCAFIGSRTVVETTVKQSCNQNTLRIGQKTPPYLLRTLSAYIKVFALLLALGLSANMWGAETWTRVTTVKELTDGGTFIMGYEATAKSGVIVPLRSVDCNAKTTTNGYFNTGITEDSSTNGTIDMSKVTTTTADYEVYITSPASGKINIQMKDKDGSYYGATSGGSTKNSGRLYTSGNSAETNLTPEFSNETNNQFKLTSDVTGQYKYLKYNTSSPRFAYYNSAGSNIVFYKKAPSGYTIDFECNGATSGCPSQLTNQTNLPNPLPTTQQKTGYSFIGWYTNSGLTAIATAGAAITANTKLYAKWNIINRTITYNGDEQLNYTAKPTNATIEDDGVEVTYSVNTGYEITGVSVTMGGTPLTENTDFTWDQDDVAILPESGITGNIVITFTTELVQACTNEISITKGTPSNGSFSLSQTGVVCIDDGNAIVSVTNITPDEHYHFKQITTDNGSVDNDHRQVTNISANTTINVEFKEDPKYTITFVDAVHDTDCSAWNMNSYAGTQIVFNSITDKTAVAPTGDCVADHYHFVGWVEEDTTPTQSPSNVIPAGTTSIKITKDVTYKAVWAQEEL